MRRSDVAGIIGHTVLVNSGFRTEKFSSENYPQFGHGLSKTFSSPVLGRKVERISVLRGTDC